MSALSNLDAENELFTFLGLTLTAASRLTFCLGDHTGLDHDGFEDAVRPTKSDPIQPCFVSRQPALAGRREIQEE